MTAKFQPVPLKTRIENPVVSVRLPPEMIAPFYKMCRETGVTPNALGLQCIQFALANSKS